MLRGLGPAFTQSPEFYLHSLDAVNEAAYLVRLSARHYQDASFLDDRVLGPDTPGLWAPLGELEAQAAALPERCHYIFHVGHVGSTLLSRLLGGFAGVHSLREPMALPTLAHLRSQLDRPESLWSVQQYEDALSLCLKLWSRTWQGNQTSLIKATSWASDLAPSLLARPGKARAVMMTVSPEAYLAGVLVSPAGLGDIKGSAATAMTRLHRRLGEMPWVLHRMSPGERTAMVWACEMLCMDQAARDNPGQALWIDFEAFLERPADRLQAALAHLGQVADPDAVQAAVTGPTMSRYSKNPGQAFDPATRKTLLSSSRLTNRTEILKGQAWLADAGARFPDIGRLWDGQTPLV